MLYIRKLRKKLRLIMENIIINIAEEQLINCESMDIVFKNYNWFFDELFNTFLKTQEAKQEIVLAANKLNNKEIRNKIELLKGEIIHTYGCMHKQMIFEKLPRFILFIGSDSSWDAHGMIIKNEPYVFINVTMVIPRIESNEFDMDLFITHEMVHAIHYNYLLEFYLGNYNTIEDRYFKRLISEGMATFMSSKILNKDLINAYWIGFIPDSEVAKWIENAEELKANMGNKLRASLKKEQFSTELFSQLFYVKASDSFNKYRLGYYYGTRIIEKLGGSYDLLKTPYNKYSSEIFKYFSI